MIQDRMENIIESIIKYKILNPRIVSLSQWIDNLQFLAALMERMFFNEISPTEDCLVIDINSLLS